MTVEIVRLTPDNSALVGRVADDVFDAEIVPERLAAFLADAGHLMLIAVDEGVVVGQIAAIIHRHPDQPTELYVDNLGVTTSHRRQGIARRLLAEMLVLGRELGCEECWVGTEIDNQPARNLYSRYAKAGIFALYEFDL
jgi:aminoglycoside 6'-N-acetyltransferase I